MNTDKLKELLAWIVARMEEPSTWAGTGLIAFELHQLGVSDPLVAKFLALGVAIGGVLSVVFPEKKKDVSKTDTTDKK